MKSTAQISSSKVSLCRLHEFLAQSNQMNCLDNGSLIFYKVLHHDNERLCHHLVQKLWYWVFEVYLSFVETLELKVLVLAK